MLKPLWLALGMAPGLAAAQAITVDPSSSARLTTSANGTPVIEIATPNASGLSHNKLTDFNVAHPGVILGNNAAGGASHIGGYVLHNPQLQPGNEARAILTEVTGANPSHLSGTVEVFGRQADVFIANKNGLHFDGVTFLNAGGVTATTGTPIVGPDALHFQVDGGRIGIGPGGVDTTGLSFFDIVAQQAALNGAVGSAGQGTDLAVVAGANTWDATTRTHRASASPPAQPMPVAISGDAAGAMYGRNITFVSTESGAGVRHAGALLAAGDIVIDAQGPMQVATLRAGRDVDLRGSGDIEVRDGRGIDATGAVRLASEGDITVAQGASVVGDTLALQAAQRVLVQAAHLGARNATLGGAVKAIRIHAGEFVIEGELVAWNLDGSPVSPDQPLVVHEGRLQIQRSGWQWDDQFTLESTATVVSGAGVEIVADRFVNDEGIVRDTGRNGSTIDVRELTNSGLVSTAGDLRLVADRFASACADGANVAGRFQQLCGGFVSAGDVSADLGQMTSDGALLANGLLVLTLGDGQHRVGAAGGLAGGDGVAIAQADGARAQLTTAGETTSRGDIRLDLEDLTQTADGSLRSQAGDVDVRAAGNVVNAGEVSTGGNVHIEATDVRNQEGASLLALAGDIRVDARNVLVNEVSTQVMATNVALHAGTAIDNSALVLGFDTVHARSDGTLTNTAAALMSARELHLAGDRIVNQAGTLLEAGETLVIDSEGDVVNAEDSVISSGNTIEILAGGDVVNDASSISAVETVIEAGGRIVNRNGGSIVSEAVALAAKGDVENVQGAIVGARQVGIVAGGGVTNRGQDAVVTGENVDIQALGGDLRNEATAVIRAGDSTRLAASRTLLNDNAAIAGTHVVLDADVVDNRDAALVEAVDDVDIAATRVHNTGGAAILGEDIDITASAEFASDTGAMVRGTNVAIDTSTVAARDGQVLAERHLDLRAHAFGNTATMHSKDTATLTMKDGRSLVIDAGHHAPTADTLLAVHTHDLTIADNGEMRNPGSIAIHATGDVRNRHVLMTGQSLSVDARGSIENAAGALLWAADGATLKAGHDIVNREGAQLQTLRGDIDLVANRVENHVGRIASGRDLLIDAATVVNQGRATGGLQDAGAEAHADHYKWHHSLRYTEFWLDFDLPLFTSGLAIESAVMASRRDIRINQRDRKGTGAQVHNNDSQLLATRDVLVDGHLHNRSTSIEDSLADYLRHPATAVHFSAKDKLAANKLNRSFANFYEFLDWVLGDTTDNGHTIFGSYKVTDGNIITGLKQFTGDRYAPMMSAILGADYKDKNLSELAGRWAAFKAREAAGTAPTTSYYGDRRAEISAGGTLVHTGGTFHNGGERKERTQVDVTIGSETVRTIEADFETDFGGAFNVHGDYDMAGLVAWLNPRDVLDGLRNNLMFREQPDLPPLVLDDVGSVLVAGAAVGVHPLPAAAPKVHPLFETNNAFLDPSLYFNSADFLRRMHYPSDRTVPVLGDSYAMHVYVWGQIEHTLGNWYAERHGMDDIQAVEFLSNNGLAVAGDLGLRVGVPLTKDQYENLDDDIVWLEKTVVNGREVLHLQFYPSKATLAARSEQSRAGAVVSAGGDVSIDAESVQNIDGILQAGGNVRIASAGDVVNQANGGAQSGIRAEGTVDIAAGGDIEHTGATIEGHQVRLAAEGDIVLSTTTRLDEHGNLVSRHDGGVFGNGDDNAVHLEAGDDIRMTGVEVDADTLRLKAGGNVDIEDVYEVESFLHQETGSRFLGHSETTQQGASASSTGSSLTAREQLILEVGGDFTITGGSIDAMNTSGTVGGDFTAVAGKDLEHYREDFYSIGFERGSRASAGGHEYTEDDSGHGKQTYAGPVGDGMNSGEAGAPGRQDAMHNTGGLQGRIGFGWKSSSYDRESTDYTNVQLNLGSGSLDVGGTFDFGGADLNVADYQQDASLEVSAGEITTTKYENVLKETMASSQSFFGETVNAGSSFVNVSNEWGKKGTDYADGKKEDGMVAAATAGQASQLVFDEAASFTLAPTFMNTKSSSSSEKRAENVNHVGGNFTFNSRGDITLTGVKTTKADADIVLDAAGDVNLLAARSTMTESTDSTSTMVNLGSINAGCTMYGCGFGAAVTYEGGTENTSDHATTWENTVLGGSGANVAIRSGGDTTLHGAVVEGRVDLQVGGDLDVRSVQDERNYERVRASWGASGGVGMSTMSLGVPIPTGSGHSEGGRDHDRSRIVSQQSGIRATPDSTIAVDGDVRLQGGFITGGGDLLVGGDIHAETLADTRERDGGYGGGGGGISKNAMISVSVVAGRVDHAHYDADNRATIDMDIQGLPGSDDTPAIHGDLNTNPDEMHVVHRDEEYAGTDMRFTFSMPMGGKDKPKNKPRGNRVAPAPAPDAPSTPRPPASGGVDAPSTPRPGTPDADAPGTPRPGTPDVDAPSTPRPDTPDADAPSTPTPKPPASGDGDGASTPKPPAQGGDTTDSTPQATPKPKKAPFDGNIRYKGQVEYKKVQNAMAEVNNMTNAQLKDLARNPVRLTLNSPLGDQTVVISSPSQFQKLHGMPIYDGTHVPVYLHVTAYPGGTYGVQYKTRPPMGYPTVPMPK